MPSNPLRVDPTRTITLRRRLVQQVILTIRRLRGRIEASTFERMTIPEFDSFLHFEINGHVLTRYQQLVWGKSTLDLFRRGVERTLADSVRVPRKGDDGTRPSSDAVRLGGGGSLSGTGSGDGRLLQSALPDTSYTQAYLYGSADGERRGHTRAVLSDERTGVILRLLQTTAWEEVRGVTEDLVLRCKRALSEGMLKGLSRSRVLERLTSVLRVSAGRLRTVANTELVRAFAEGQLSAMEHLKIDEASVTAEWVSGDVACAGCSKLEGVRFSVKKARGVIPFHPNCRCCWGVPGGRNK